MDMFLSTMLEMKMIEAFGSEKFKKIEEEHDINVLVEYLTFYRYARTSVLETLLFQVKRIVEDFEDIEVSKIDDNEIKNKFFYTLLPKNQLQMDQISIRFLSVGMRREARRNRNERKRCP